MKFDAGHGLAGEAVAATEQQRMGEITTERSATSATYGKSDLHPRPGESLPRTAGERIRWTGRASLLGAIGIAALFFLAIAPTLRWMEFFNGTENINVATAIETRRDGHWLLPTLDGLPRIVKPPLTDWLTAATVRTGTVARMSASDPAIRAAAQNDVAFEVRWGALLCSCVMLVAVFELGRTLGGRNLGLVSALACGSSLLFLRFSRLASTDVQLALWVTVANVFLAKALFENRRWLGCIGTGVALGLAMMSKGPVALVESVVPVVLFVLLMRAMGWRQGAGASQKRRWIGPVSVGMGLMLLIELPWYFYVCLLPGDQWKTWLKEVTATNSLSQASAWYSYVSFSSMFLPWLPFLIYGGLAAVVGWIQGRGRPDRHQQFESDRRLLLALLLLFIPLLIMSFFKEKRERYVLPMAAPAAILAASGLLHSTRPLTRRRPMPPGGFEIVPLARAGPPTCPMPHPGHLRDVVDPRDIVDPRDVPDLRDPPVALDPGGAFTTNVHYICLAAMGIGLPLIGAAGYFDRLRTMDGRPLYSVPWGTAIAGGMALLLWVSARCAGMFARRGRSGWSATVTASVTVAVMLVLQAVFYAGYRRMPQGMSAMRPLAQTIWARYPSAIVLNVDGATTKGPVDLSIYANRIIPPISHEQAVTITPPAPGQPPYVAVIKRRDPAHLPVLPGWTLFQTISDQGGQWWYAFVLDSSPDRAR